MFPLTCWKTIWSVGRRNFFFIFLFFSPEKNRIWPVILWKYKYFVEGRCFTFLFCIFTDKNSRIGRVSGNTAIFYAKLDKIYNTDTTSSPIFFCSMLIHYFYFNWLFFGSISGIEHIIVTLKLQFGMSSRRKYLLLSPVLTTGNSFQLSPPPKTSYLHERYSYHWLTSPYIVRSDNLMSPGVVPSWPQLIPLNIICQIIYLLFKCTDKCQRLLNIQYTEFCLRSIFFQQLSHSYHLNIFQSVNVLFNSVMYFRIDHG